MVTSFDELVQELMLGSSASSSSSSAWSSCSSSDGGLEELAGNCSYGSPEPASLADSSCPSPASSSHHGSSTSGSIYDESHADLMSQLDEMLAAHPQQPSTPTIVAATSTNGFVFSHRLLATAPAVTTVAAPSAPQQSAAVAVGSSQPSSAVRAELKPAKAKEDKFSTEFPHAMLCYPYKYDLKISSVGSQVNIESLKLQLVDAETFEIPQWPGASATNASKPIITVESILPDEANGDSVSIRFSLHMCSFHYRKKASSAAAQDAAAVPASQMPFRLVLVDTRSNSNMFVSVEFATYARKRVKNAALFEFGGNNVAAPASAAVTSSAEEAQEDAAEEAAVAPAPKKQRLNEAGKAAAKKQKASSAAPAAPAVVEVKSEPKSLVSSVPTRQFFAQLGAQKQQQQSPQLVSQQPSASVVSMAQVPAQYALAVFQTQLQHYWIDPVNVAVDEDLKASLERTSQAVQFLRSLSPLELQAAMLNCQLLANLVPSKQA